MRLAKRPLSQYKERVDIAPKVKLHPVIGVRDDRGPICKLGPRKRRGHYDQEQPRTQVKACRTSRHSRGASSSIHGKPCAESLVGSRACVRVRRTSGISGEAPNGLGGLASRSRLPAEARRRLASKQLLPRAAKRSSDG
jgi:hypothetical protein